MIIFFDKDKNIICAFINVNKNYAQDSLYKAIRARKVSSIISLFHDDEIKNQCELLLQEDSRIYANDKFDLKKLFATQNYYHFAKQYQDEVDNWRQSHANQKDGAKLNACSVSPDLLTIEPNIKLDSIESTNTNKEECDSIGSSNVMPEAATITNVCGAMQCDMGTDKSQARNDESNNMHAPNKDKNTFVMQLEKMQQKQSMLCNSMCDSDQNNNVHLDTNKLNESDKPSTSISVCDTPFSPVYNPPSSPTY